MKASDLLLQYSSLDGVHKARDHFKSIKINSGKDGLSGSIEIESNAWMNIAVPVKNKRVKEYFIDRIMDKIRKQTPNAKDSDVFEVLKAFPNSDESTRKWLIYFPDLTPENSEGNFYLVSKDGDYDEISGFLVKTKDFTNIYSDPLIFDWDTKDGE